MAALIDVACEVRFANLGNVTLFNADPVQKLGAAFRQNRGGVVLPLGELQPPYHVMKMLGNLDTDIVAI